MTMPEIKLKPCPICGGKAKICNSSLGYFVECVASGHLHNSGALYESAKEAAEDWNRRSDNGKV